MGSPFGGPDWDPDKAGDEVSANNPMQAAINALMQSGMVDSKTAADILNGMIMGLLSEVFVPLSRAKDWATVYTTHGKHIMEVNLNDGSTVKVEVTG